MTQAGDTRFSSRHRSVIVPRVAPSTPDALKGPVVPTAPDPGRQPGRRRADRSTSARRSSAAPQADVKGTTAGRRRAETGSRTGTRSNRNATATAQPVPAPPADRPRRASRPRRRWLPTPAVAGATALVVAGIGAVVVSSSAVGSSADLRPAAPAVACRRCRADVSTTTTHRSRQATSAPPTAARAPRSSTVSRDVDRETLQQQAELQAEQRHARRSPTSPTAVQERADELRSDQWVLPVAGYHDHRHLRRGQLPVVDGPHRPRLRGRRGHADRLGRPGHGDVDRATTVRTATRP